MTKTVADNQVVANPADVLSAGELASLGAEYSALNEAILESAQSGASEIVKIGQCARASVQLYNLIESRHGEAGIARSIASITDADIVPRGTTLKYAESDGGTLTVSQNRDKYDVRALPHVVRNLLAIPCPWGDMGYDKVLAEGSRASVFCEDTERDSVRAAIAAITSYQDTVVPAQVSCLQRIKARVAKFVKALPDGTQVTGRVKPVNPFAK